MIKLNDDFFNYLVATDELDDFLGLKDEFKTKEAIDKEIEEIKIYNQRLNDNGIYTDWQKKDLEYNKNRLKQLEELKENM